MNEIISEVQKQEWRKSYLSNSYLTHLSVSDLERRLDDILLNLLVFSKDGSLSFDQSNQMNGFIERFIHLDEEMCQREISINLLNKANEYSKKYSNILKAINIWNDRKQIVGGYLVKFSKIEFLNQIKRFGKIRVNPASYYNDSSLNIAVRDDELSQKMILPLQTKLKKKMSTGEFEEIKGIKNIFMTVDACSYLTRTYTIN